jgi:di/tricarboxylate transporter
MTLEIGFLFALIAAMVYLFLTEKLPVDLTAFSGLVILVLSGYLTPQEAFTGFASPAVITMLSVFVVGAALLHTGVADVVGKKVYAWIGGREVFLIAALMFVAGILSAFMNNIAAVAVLMPAVASIAKESGVSPSRLFMPLSFGAILGGTTTLVGTPPNILAAAMLEERGLEPFGMFDFTPVGLVLLGGGIVFMTTFGRKLLPQREIGPTLEESRDLAEVYQLKDRLFTLRIPEHSGLDGLSMAEAKLGSRLGVQVLAITRKDQHQLAPEPGTLLHGGDLLLVEGQLEDLRRLLRVQGIRVHKAEAEELPPPILGVTGIKARVEKDSPLIGRSLRGLRFREVFGVVVVAIQRGDDLLRDYLADERVEEDDLILAVGERDRLDKMASHPDFSSCEVGWSTLDQLRSHLYLMRIPENSPLVSSTIADSGLGELVGLTVAGVIREGQTHLAVSPKETILGGDRLLIAGDPSRILGLLELGEVSLESTVSEPTLESEEIGVVEATVAPRSLLAARTLGELSFRDRYGVQVLAIWREGALVRANLAHLALRFGDALLLHGPRAKLRQIAADPDLVVLSDLAQIERKSKKAPFAVAGLLLMIGIVVLDVQPIQVAAFTAATFVILAGALTMEEVYRAIEWRAIFLVAAVLPVGIAMERTGAALLMAESVTETAGPAGPYAVLASMVFLSSLLSQGLDGAPAVVLLTPVVTNAAEQLSLNPHTMMMGVAVAASAAFMTPFSHKANLLVMGAGGYKSVDYLRVGTPLTLVLLIVMVLLIPVLFPF